MAKIGMISLGCSKNLVDSEQMLSRLRQANYELTEDLTEADAVIVNTCGFLEAAVQEAIETVLETAQLKQSGRLRALVVTGCMVERYREKLLEEMPEVDAICGTGSYEEIVDAVTAALSGEKRAYLADSAAAALEGGRTRLTPAYTAYFKIAEGCSNRCAYCIIPQLRGPFRSRELEDLVREAEQLCASGVRELIVIAQDITKYGMDLPEHRRLLPELLRRLCRLDFTWIRLHYLYPDQITDELIDVIAAEDKIVKYLDIPLQHVNKPLLRAMHRPGGAAEFSALIQILRDRIPDLVLRTSLIVGLPGETEQAFEELCEFLKNTRIERAGVFEFSAEEGTEAAAMPDQIAPEEKTRRRLLVEELQSAVMDEWCEKQIGRTLTVLTEGFDLELGLYFGRSWADSVEVDGKVYFSSDTDAPAGTFVPVFITGGMGADLRGAREEM